MHLAFSIWEDTLHLDIQDFLQILKSIEVEANASFEKTIRFEVIKGDSHKAILAAGRMEGVEYTIHAMRKKLQLWEETD